MMVLGLCFPPFLRTWMSLPALVAIAAPCRLWWSSGSILPRLFSCLVGSIPYLRLLGPLYGHGLSWCCKVLRFLACHSCKYPWFQLPLITLLALCCSNISFTGLGYWVGLDLPVLPSGATIYLPCPQTLGSSEILHSRYYRWWSPRVP